jgi:beta-lactamase regulating signal transducer with metallopeptidase domain
MTHTLQAIAWTLIHFSWQAVAIAALYLVCTWVTARRSSQVRYLLSLSALLLMLASAVTTFTWEIRSNQPTAFAFASLPASSQQTSASAFLIKDEPGFPPTSANAQPTALVGTLSPDILSWIDGLWVLGVVALSLRSLGGWWIIHRLRSSAIASAPAAVQSSFERIATAMGLRRSVLLRISTSIGGPMTVGTLRAIVLLPLSAATSLNPDELEVVLAHELAHIRRADFFWNLLQTLAETLFFFHPAVWWISGRIRHDRELCCDDLALQVCPNPIVYARALCRLEEQRSRALHLAMALDGHQSRQTLRMRICRILGEPMTQMKGGTTRPLSLAAACAALVVLALPVPHVLAGLNPQQEAAPAGAIAGNPSPAQLDLPPVVSVKVPEIVKTAPADIHVDVATHVSDPARAIAADMASQSQDKKPASTTPKSNYMDEMKSAGYDVDLDKYLAMKIQNVTPEYARSMATVGLGKPTADQLVACKIQGVTPDYIAQLKQKGFEVNSFEDAISFRIFEVTPEFSEAIKAAGFTTTSKQLVAMRIQHVTPEFARDIHRRFPNATSEDLVTAGVFKINDAFIASAEKHGFTNLSFQKLVQLRISGLLDDESK